MKACLGLGCRDLGIEGLGLKDLGFQKLGLRDLRFRVYSNLGPYNGESNGKEHGK